MIISEDSVRKIIDAIASANQIGITCLIIDKDSIRGTSEDGAIILLDKNEIKIPEFNAVGIPRDRVAVFNNRLNIMNLKELPKMEADLHTRDNQDQNVLRFVMTSKRTSIEFKCADPLQIKAPKNLRSDIAYSFDLSKDTLELMTKSNSAMSSGTAPTSFFLEDGIVFFKVSDSEGDMLKHVVSTKCLLTEAAPKDTFYYTFNGRHALKLLKLALKNDEKVTINITPRGTLNLKINNLDVFLGPEIL